MRALVKFTDIVDRINEWVGKVFGFLIIATMVVVVYDVCARYFFNRPTTWGMETSTLLLCGTVFLGGGYCLLHGGHVKVDIIYARWSPRAKAVVDLITYLLLLSICVVLLWYGGETAWDSLIHHKVSTSAWAPPLWPGQIVIPIGGILIGLQGLAKWIRDWITAVTGEKKLESKIVRGEGGIFAKED